MDSAPPAPKKARTDANGGSSYPDDDTVSTTPPPSKKARTEPCSDDDIKSPTFFLDSIPNETSTTFYNVSAVYRIKNIGFLIFPWRVLLSYTALQGN